MWPEHTHSDGAHKFSQLLSRSDLSRGRTKMDPEKATEHTRRGPTFGHCAPIFQNLSLCRDTPYNPRIRPFFNGGAPEVRISRAAITLLLARRFMPVMARATWGFVGLEIAQHGRGRGPHGLPDRPHMCQPSLATRSHRSWLGKPNETWLQIPGTFHVSGFGPCAHSSAQESNRRPPSSRRQTFTCRGGGSRVTYPTRTHVYDIMGDPARGLLRSTWPVWILECPTWPCPIRRYSIRPNSISTPFIHVLGARDLRISVCGNPTCSRPKADPPSRQRLTRKPDLI